MLWESSPCNWVVCQLFVNCCHQLCGIEDTSHLHKFAVSRWGGDFSTSLVHPNSRNKWSRPYLADGWQSHCFLIFVRRSKSLFTCWNQLVLPESLLWKSWDMIVPFLKTCHLPVNTSSLSMSWPHRTHFFHFSPRPIHWNQPSSLPAWTGYNKDSATTPPGPQWHLAWCPGPKTSRQNCNVSGMTLRSTEFTCDNLKSGRISCEDPHCHLDVFATPFSHINVIGAHLLPIIFPAELRISSQERCFSMHHCINSSE